jgi:hypothetical protein
MLTGGVMLHEFVTLYREEIIDRCRTKVATRSSPSPTKLEIDHGVPMFLDQLVDELRLGLSASSEIAKTAARHGHDLRRQGFTVSQVVHDYGDVCQVITEMAVELKAPISPDDFRMLNRCLDDAIANAVTEFGCQREQSIDAGATSETERLGVLARELRDATVAANIALEAIKSGRVGVAGSTATVLNQNLLRSQDLIDRLVAEVEGYVARRVTDPVT